MSIEAMTWKMLGIGLPIIWTAWIIIFIMIEAARKGLVAISFAAEVYLPLFFIIRF